MEKQAFTLAEVENSDGRRVRVSEPSPVSEDNEPTKPTACRRNYPSKKNFRLVKAFTLAEVLITLGIIGVVAAITIPTMISNNNKRIVETRLAKFYSSVNQAIELSEVYNGPKEKWEIKVNNNPSEWFRTYLEPYIKITNVVYGDTVNVYFVDGSLCRITKTSITFYPKADDQNKPNIKGKNSFSFYFCPSYNGNESAYGLNAKKYHIGKGIEPYMYEWNGNYNSLKTNGTYGCNKNNNNRAYCTQLIRVNNWKIPDDYPFKF